MTLLERADKKQQTVKTLILSSFDQIRVLAVQKIFVRNAGLGCLPVELQEYWPKYQKILAIDPFQVFGWPSHDLIGKLKGCRAIEIDWDNISYRLVYQIHEKSKPKRVLILSFAEHDPAYKKAKQRK